MPELVVSAKLDLSSFNAEVQNLERILPIPTARALNRAGASMKTLAVREIANDLGVKQMDIRDRIGVREATPDRLEVLLSASPRRIPIIDFNARGPEPSRGRGTGVRARIGGSAANYPKAFIATMKSGHRGVFSRSTTARLPIYEMFGPSVWKVFLKYVQPVLDRGREQLLKNLASEIRFAMRGAA